MPSTCSVNPNLFHGLELLVYDADIKGLAALNIAVSQVFSDTLYF